MLPSPQRFVEQAWRHPERHMPVGSMIAQGLLLTKAAERRRHLQPLMIIKQIMR